jgi:hypothetical protein
VVPLLGGWERDEQLVTVKRQLCYEMLHKKGVGHVARMREMRNAYKILVGKLEGKRPL